MKYVTYIYIYMYIHYIWNDTIDCARNSCIIYVLCKII